MKRIRLKYKPSTDPEFSCIFFTEFAKRKKTSAHQ